MPPVHTFKNTETLLSNLHMFSQGTDVTSGVFFVFKSKFHFSEHLHGKRKNIEE